MPCSAIELLILEMASAFSVWRIASACFVSSWICFWRSEYRLIGFPWEWMSLGSSAGLYVTAGIEINGSIRSSMFESLIFPPPFVSLC